MNGRAIPGAYLFRPYVCDNHVSANECNSGTNYLREPRYHCTLNLTAVLYGCETWPLT